VSPRSWRVCPRCLAIAKARYFADKQRVEDAYGQVGREEYLKLAAGLGEPPTFSGMPESLREDYEIILTVNGEFSVSYGCRCENCDFRHEFNHVEQLEFNDAD
jgi:hypothetical protein